MDIYGGIKVMGKIRFPKKKHKGSIWEAISSGVLLGELVPILSYVGIMIMWHTGIWWFPLIIAYFVAFGVPVTCWYKNREKGIYHAHVGDEEYYTDHPDELDKLLRKVRKAGLPESVQRTARYYRSRPDVVKEFPAKKEKKRRVREAILHIGATITVIPGIFMIWKAFPFPSYFFTQPVKTADYTSLFLLASGILVLVSAYGLFKHKSFLNVRFSNLRFATAIVMALSIWSEFIAWSIAKRPTYTNIIAYAVCMGVFLIAGLALPAIAGDVRTAKQVWHDKKELKIKLFEMGYIREIDLQAFESLNLD